MTFSLKIWINPRNGSERLYLNGTTRKSVYFKCAEDGRVVWSSKANDTPHKFQTGDHYGKIRKDREAATSAAEAFGVALGEGSGEQEWSALRAIAERGLIIEAAE